MAISASSRYSTADVVTFDVDGAARQVIIPATPAVTTFSYTSHVYSSDETIDGLAFAYFGDATLWWQIANVNPEIMDWRSITPGTIIRIPML